MSDYIPTIGIECHVQLKTKTKLFSAVDNDARTAEPNTLISHICIGLPGALPVLNEKAIELAVKAAFALNTTPQTFSKFDRKHYFYPDLPMGYQITQYEEPVITGGYVDVIVDGREKRIRITRAHLEADAGKSGHPAGTDYSLVDLNRAGTPLLEIVSEPDMHSAAEAKAYAYELYLLMRYASVSDADMYHGNMRFDVNVSVSKDASKLGTRTETKNLNSFRSVEKAVEHEIKRQIDELEHGRPIVQETRGWDEAKQKTFSQRSKEDAHDYRYFPDPDLPPIVLDEVLVAKTEKSMPFLPGQYRGLFKGLGLDSASIETLIYEISSAQFVSAILSDYGEEHARRVANWLVNTAAKPDETEPETVSEINTNPEAAVKLSELVQTGKLSSTAAKQVWLEISKKGGDPDEVAKKLNLGQVSDSKELEAIVDKVINDNPQAADDVRNGEMKAIGFLVGQVMKESNGKANPNLVSEIIKTKLSQAHD